jgi:hypothetical protein
MLVEARCVCSSDREYVVLDQTRDVGPPYRVMAILMDPSNASRGLAFEIGEFVKKRLCTASYQVVDYTTPVMHVGNEASESPNLYQEPYSSIVRARSVSTFTLANILLRSRKVMDCDCPAKVCRLPRVSYKRHTSGILIRPSLTIHPMLNRKIMLDRNLRILSIHTPHRRSQFPLIRLFRGSYRDQFKLGVIVGSSS